MAITKSHLNSLTYQVIGAAIDVHKALGPGLLERVYHQCLKRELYLKKLSFESEKKVDIVYKGIKLDCQLRCDFVIEKVIIVELKAVETLLPVHQAQLLTYMKLLQVPKGILINFNVAHLFRSGQKTMVNELFKALPEE